MAIEFSYLIDLVLNAQAATVFDCAPVAAPAVTPTPAGFTCDNCGGSAFSAIAASFGTIGYWAQAAWLHQIYGFGMSNVVMLAYIFSVVTGIVGFVMGASPRQYIWLFVGPGLFYWLTEYRTAVSGVAWMVADEQRDQREVWRMTETGLLNEDYVQRFGFTTSKDNSPQYTGAGPLVTERDTPCGQTDGACISNFFGYFDQVVSGVVQQLINFVGAGRKMYSAGGTGTNIVGDPTSPGTQIYYSDIMNDLRWNFFASIAEARINNADLRRSFASFLSSECGDDFISSINQERLHAAKENQTSPLYTTMLESTESTVGWGSFTVKFPSEIKLWSKLTAIVPTPTELKSFITHDNATGPELNTPGEQSNALYFADLLRTAPRKTRLIDFNIIFSPFPILTPTLEQYSAVPPIDEMLSCKTFLLLLMQGLRWEAAHISYQIMTSGPSGMHPLNYVASMLYGMDIKYPLSFAPSGPPGFGTEPANTQIKLEHVPQFIEALVLSRIFANELQVSPAVAAQSQSQYSEPVANKNIADIKQFQRVNNQFSKFGELYTWAQMVPYFQGQLLYYLAIAYPFAAMFVVIPGMFKGFIQWCQFWIWVKLWDLGFALVAVLERSVWSITTSSNNSSEFNSLIMQIASVNGAQGTGICAAYSGGAALSQRTPVPLVAIDPFYSPVTDTVFNSHDRGIFYMQWLLDRLIAASGNIGLNMANTYYIYIMSALYLSVPVICGTLVLGAKSGMASMLGSTMGGISSPAGGAASNAATGNYTKALGSNQATFGQEAFAKSLRSGSGAGFAKQALDAQNVSTAEQMSGGFVGTRSQALGALSGVMGSDMNAMYSNLQSAMQGGQMMLAGMDIGGTAGAKALASGDKAQAGLNDGSSVARGPGMPTMFGQGGAPSSSTAGATASGTSGGDASRDGGRTMGAGLGTGAKLLNNYGAMNNMAAMREMATTSLAAMAQLSAAQQGLAVASTGHQSASSLAGLRGQRLNEVADFAGREGQWRAQDNVAQSGMASEVAAITGSTGMVSSGQKPQSASAMAYLGRMEGGTVGAGGKFQAYGGHGSMAAARAANPGGSLDRHRNAGMADLRANYGSGFVSKAAEGGAIDPNKSVRDAAYNKSLAQTWKGVTPAVKGFQDGMVGHMMDPLVGAIGGAIGNQASAAGQALIDKGTEQKAAGHHKAGDAAIAMGQFMRSIGDAGKQGADYSKGGNVYTGMKEGARSAAKQDDSALVKKELANAQKLEKN